MANLLSRVTKIETGIDVARLSREQVQMLDMSKLSLSQQAALDVTLLTMDQIVQLGFENLTDAQLSAITNGECSWISREESAWIRSLSDDELDAAAEGRYERWEPGYKPELNA
jgi:hypothetical protein